MRNILGNILRKAAPTAVSASLLLAVAACGKAPLAAERPVPPAAPPASQNAAGSLDNLSAAASSAPQRLKVAGADNVSIDGGSDSYAHINYAPAVKMFDEAEVRSTLMGISSDGHGFLFKNASESIRSLKAGDVLMIKNKMAIKVLGVTTSEDQTLVLAGQPSLLDLAQDGEININAPVRFHGPKISARLESAPFLHKVLDLLVPPAYAQSGLQGSTTDAARQQGTQDAAKQAASAIGSAITDGWTVAKWTVVPGDGQADIDLVLTKSVSGFVAMVSMKGWIGNFDFASKLNLTRGAPAKLFQGVKNMQGNLQFDWEIGKSTSGGWSEEDRIKLPGAISIPLGPLLGGMPLTLDVSSALLIHPDLTAGGEYSRGGFAIS